MTNPKMNVFMTGGSGWIGRAVISRLRADGHEVVALARTEESARGLRAAGAQPVRGTLEDLDAVHDIARATDGVVHLAFKHETAFGEGDFAAAAEADNAVVDALGTALTGSEKPLVVTSTTTGHRAGKVITEADAPTELHGPTLRLRTERTALGFADREVRPVVVRIPTVHGVGDRSFLSWFVDLARREGVAGFVGSGANRWPTAHLADVADVFALALTTPAASGILHAVAESGVRTRDIAEVIGEREGVPAASVPPEHFGWLAEFAGFDIVVDSTRTRDVLDWSPQGGSVLESLRSVY